MQDSGKPEDAGTAKPEGAGTEATRGTISRRRGREDSGQPGDSNPRQSRKVQERGETRNHTGRRNWKSEAEGQPEASAPEAPKDARRGATRRSVAGKAGRCRNRGNPGDASAGATGRARAAGKPGAQAPDALKDARFEATRRSIAGKAGRCGSRGNPGDASGGATGGVK